jgi:tetraacyldisaccharide 4'-kinase
VSLRLRLQRWAFREQAGTSASLLSAGVARYQAATAPIERPRPAGPTLLVGGPALGGAGRTAVVAWLAKTLHAQGEPVVVLGHGYGGRGRGLRLVVDDLDRDGDEAVALRQALPEEVAVWVGPRRPGIVALARPGSVLLVDGGLLDALAPASAVLAVVDATASQRVLPAGPLRCDLATAAAVSQCLWWHRVDQPGAQIRPGLKAAGSQLHSAVIPTALLAPNGTRVNPDWLRGRPVVALAAIARPEAFVHTLEAAGAQVVFRRFLSDHSRFRAADLAGLPPGIPVVTTTKDAPRLPAGWPVWVLETTLQVTGDLDTALWRWLR